MCHPENKYGIEPVYDSQKTLEGVSASFRKNNLEKLLFNQYSLNLVMKLSTLALIEVEILLFFSLKNKRLKRIAGNSF